MIAGGQSFKHPVFFVGCDRLLGDSLCRALVSLELESEWRLSPDVQICDRNYWKELLPQKGPGLIFIEMLNEGVAIESALIQEIRAYNANLQMVLLVEPTIDFYQIASVCRIGNIIRRDRFDSSILRALVIRLLSGNIFGFSPYFPNGFSTGPIYKTFHGEVILDELITTCFDTIIPRIPKDHSSIFKCFIHELLTNTVAYAIGGITAEDRDKNLTPAPSKIVIPERRAIKVTLVGDAEKNAVSVQDSSGSLSLLRVLEKLRRHTCMGDEKTPPGMWDGSGRGMSLIHRDSRLVINILKGVRTETIFMHYLKEEMNRYESVIITEVTPLAL